MAGVTLDAQHDGAEPDTGEAAPTWVLLVTFVLALIGLGISTYLTIEHFQPAILACSENSVVDCAAVTTSPESHFLGIPVAFLGLFQYVVMVGLCSPWAWRARRREIHLARLAFACVGMGFVLWLITAEVIYIGKICLWCTGVHLVTFALFLIVIQTVPRMLGWTRR